MIEPEYEIKLLLSRAEYNFLLHLFCNHWSPPKIQTNHYYDTNSQTFRKQNTTVRIRETDSKFIGTVKKHLGTDSHSIEEKFHVDTLPPTMTLEGTIVYLKGILETERRSVQLSDTLTLMLDCNRYLTIEDYELELEHDTSSHEKAKGIMLLVGKLLNIQSDSPSLSKSERFFRRLNMIGEQCND